MTFETLPKVCVPVHVLATKPAARAKESHGFAASFARAQIRVNNETWKAALPFSFASEYSVIRA